MMALTTCDKIHFFGSKVRNKKTVYTGTCILSKVCFFKQIKN